jgi:hypothetical protein
VRRTLLTALKESDALTARVQEMPDGREVENAQVMLVNNESQ